MNRARRMWGLLEPIHVVSYFTPEARAAADALGMRGFWMGYAAQRSAPLGAVGPGIATAAFFGFHPDRLERALPDAWELTTPAAALAARLDGAGAALRRLWGDDVVGAPATVEAAELAWRAAAAAGCAGRVLAAANQVLPRPPEPHLALWQAATTLREHRGDGHIAVLVARGITPVGSHLIKAAAGESDPEVLRTGRKFDEQAWDEGAAALRADGVLTADGQLTDAGGRLHAEIEDTTDAAADGPWRALGDAATNRLADLLAPLAAAVLDSGTLPQPNPVGFVTASS
jgi:helix-turn-helix protein